MARYDYGQGAHTLTTAMARVRDARSDLDAVTRQIDARVAGEQVSWRGAGGGAFFALHQAWQARVRTIVGALDDFAAALSATESVNVATDEAAEATMTRLAGRLG